MKTLTFASTFERHNNAAPGIHDTFSKADNIVQHLKVRRILRLSRDASSLLQDLRNNRQVRLELGTDSLSDIAEALQDGRLELIAKRGTPEVVEKRIHELIAERRNLGLQGARDI